jgi:hypothetical protein
MARDAPIHIVAINHFEGTVSLASHPVAGRTVNMILNMDPVWENDKRREFIHALPVDSFTRFDVFDHL